MYFFDSPCIPAVDLSLHGTATLLCEILISETSDSLIPMAIVR